MNVVLEIRRRGGLTQELLARRVGLSPSSISAYENGHTSPTLQVVGRLAKAANVDVEVTVRGRPHVDEGDAAALSSHPGEHELHVVARDGEHVPGTGVLRGAGDDVGDVDR